MNEGIHLDLDTWIVPGQIRKANLCRGLGNRYTPACSLEDLLLNPALLNIAIKIRRELFSEVARSAEGQAAAVAFWSIAYSHACH